MNKETINPLSIYSVEDVAKLFECGVSKAYWIMNQAKAINIGGKKVLGINLIEFASGQAGVSELFTRKLAEKVADAATYKGDTKAV